MHAFSGEVKLAQHVTDDRLVLFEYFSVASFGGATRFELFIAEFTAIEKISTSGFGGACASSKKIDLLVYSPREFEWPVEHVDDTFSNSKLVGETNCNSRRAARDGKPPIYQINNPDRTMVSASAKMFRPAPPAYLPQYRDANRLRECASDRFIVSKMKSCWFRLNRNNVGK